MFDLIGATYSVANSGNTLGEWSPILIFVAVGFGSYFLYHKPLQENTNGYTASGTAQGTLTAV